MTQQPLQDPLREARSLLLECSKNLRGYLMQFAPEAHLPKNLFPNYSSALPENLCKPNKAKNTAMTHIAVKEKKTPATVKEKPSSPTKTLKPPHEDLSDIARHMQAHFPQATWHENPLKPSPQSSLLPPCYLYISKQHLQHPFFQNLAHTLSFYFICHSSLPPTNPPEEIKALTLLSPEITSTCTPVQKDIPFPVITLKHPDTYCKYPEEKKKLWQTLYPHLPSCQTVTLQK